MFGTSDEIRQDSLRCMIDSDLENLDRLNVQYPWLPNTDRIRPTDHILQLKREKLTEILLEWDSFTDYVLHTVFLRACDLDEISSARSSSSHPSDYHDQKANEAECLSGDLMTEHFKFSSHSSSYERLKNKKKKVHNPKIYYVDNMKDRNSDLLEVIFQENPFPYNLDHGFHWIIWYNCHNQPYSNDLVTRDIQDNIFRLLGPGVSFDFAWYLNPKMTVPELFHVQVFWTK